MEERGVYTAKVVGSTPIPPTTASPFAFDPTPFKDLLVSGPYTRKGKRRFVNIKNPATNKTTSMSYARYLVCLSENRILGKQEVVDHIDGNPLNDTLTNLRILTPTENIKLAKKQKNMTRTIVTLVCPVCNTTFKREKRNTHLCDGREQIASLCSRSCSAKWSNKEFRDSIINKKINYRHPLNLKNS